MKIFLQLFCLFIFAQNGFTKEGISKRLDFKSFTVKDGISNNYIRKTIQDEFGFIWVATINGLNKYDGSNFQFFQQGTSSNSLPGNDISDLATDTPGHKIWIAQSYFGISYVNTLTNEIRQEIKFSDKTAFPLPDHWITCITMKNDDLWIGTNIGLTVYNTKTKKFYTLADSGNTTENVFKKVKTIQTDKFNNVWAFYENGSITVYDCLSRKVIYETNIIDNNTFERSTAINDVAYDKDKNSFFISTENKIIEFDGNLKKQNILSILWTYTSETVYIKRIDASHILCVGQNSFFVIDPLTYKIENLSANYILSTYKIAINNIFVDHQQGIWLCTQSGIWLSHPLDFPFSIFNFYTDAIEQKHLKSINIINNNSIVIKLERGFAITNTLTNETKYYPSEYSYDFFLSFNDSILYSRKEGIFIAKKTEDVDKNFSSLDNSYPELKQLKHLGISDCIFLNDSVDVFLSRDKSSIVLWNFKKRKTSFLSASVYPLELSSTINKIYKDSNNKLWILTDSKVLIYDLIQNKLRTILPDNKLSLFFDIIQLKDAYYLSSYNNGIVVINKNYQLTNVINKEKHGLYNNQALNLFPENKTSAFFWLTTSGGLSRINSEDLSVSNFDVDDGIPGNGFQLDCGVWAKDKIFLYDTKGFIKIEPKGSMLFKHASQLVVTGYKLQQNHSEFDSAMINVPRIQVPSDILQTTVYFRFTNYINTKNNNYSYRISEFQNEWINIEKQSYLSFIGLAPGIYHLELRGSNTVTGENKSSLILMKIMPHWYQQWWIKPLLFCFTGFIILLIYRYNIGVIREKSRIRKEFAADLHDDIGSSLNSIKIFTHLARQNPDKSDYFSQIEAILKQTSSSIRDMIWVLDNSNDTFDELVDRLKRFLSPVAEANNIRLSLSMQNELRNKPISKSLKRNLYFIAKETINNSIKYSGCDLIQMKIELERDTLRIALTDNGSGFNLAEVQRGNGLANMEFRAGQIGFLLDISSLNGIGTEVLLTSKKWNWKSFS